MLDLNRKEWMYPNTSILPHSSREIFPVSVDALEKNF